MSIWRRADMLRSGDIVTCVVTVQGRTPEGLVMIALDGASVAVDPLHEFYAEEREEIEISRLQTS